ncbi:MAG: EAL domain-containing protein [Proteobacteria bacterium]|nr:EAL domain-containing protein [Pseudomonadota bacterium]
MAIKIKTKHQNIFLGFLTAFIIISVVGKSYIEFNSNIDKVTHAEFSNLKKESLDVSQSISRHFNLHFDSFGELFYDEKIKKAVLMRNTRLKNAYKKKAYSSLLDYTLFKKLENVFVFDTEFNLLTKVNRGVKLRAKHIDLIKNRLQDYKDRQVILQKVGNTPVIMFILKLEYTGNNVAYLVVMKNLQEFVNQTADFCTTYSDFALLTKTLEYKNSLILLKGKESLETLNLQENTLFKYNKLSSNGFNYDGLKVKMNIEPLEYCQHCSVIGTIKPYFLEAQIEKSFNNIKESYKLKYVMCGLLSILYIVLLLSKVNIIDEIVKFVRAIIQKITGEKTDKGRLQAKALADQAKQQAFSYMETSSESSLQNSMLNIYKTIKRMSPEDIRNLSIKNSLSKENIRLMYQAVYDSKTMKPQFCEVFLRLLNYYGEELMPSEFIPVLKHFNMLENLDEMMLEKTINKIQSLQTKDSSAQISLNISHGAFISPTFRERLTKELSSGSIRTSNVMLEIPSYDLIKDIDAQRFLKDLAIKDVHFAISINYLDQQRTKTIVENNINHVKIDMIYFSDVLENAKKQQDLKDILHLAKKHSIFVIAEKIETELMFKLAQSLNIDLLQGYYISRPKKYFTHK